MAIQQSGLKRSEFFLTTKVPAGVGADMADAKGGSPGNASDCSTDPSVPVNYIRDTLRQLGIDYVDLVLLHGPCSFARPPVKDATASNNALWRGLEMAKAMGMTRAIGVSNYNATELSDLRGPNNSIAHPSVNQCQMSVNTSHIYLPTPYPAPHDEATIAYCREHGITYQAYRVLGGCPTHDPRLLSMATYHNKTAAQICLRWVLQRGVILTAGTGSDRSTSAKYAKENLAMFDWQLEGGEMKVLNGINSTQPM
jgi:diketogulonate reductase-like aldo/keto reductase